MKKSQLFCFLISVLILFSPLSQSSLFSQSSIIVKKQESKKKSTPPATSSNKIEFRVQVRASRQAIEPIQKLARRYHITDEIREDFSGNWYRYSIGSFPTYEDAKKTRNLLIAENGVQDAFIVVFVNGERLNKLGDLKMLASKVSPNTSFNKNGRLYRIQILAVRHSIVDVETLQNIYGLQQEVNEEVFHNWRKYTVGRFLSLNEAIKLKNDLVEKGISDAFVVIYQNGQRITINKRVN